jgi:signal transduction histidine kinase
MTIFGKPPESLLAILNDVHVAVGAVDAQHHVVYANDMAAEVLGLSQTTVDSHLRVEDLFRNYQHFDLTGNEIPVNRRPLMSVLAGEDVPPCNIKVVLPDGRFRWLHVTYHRFSVLGLKGVLIVATDETQQIELQRIATSVEKFEMLSAVAGGLAHNFNNILSIIDLTAFECIQSPDVGPEARAKLQTISDTSHDAAQLVKRLAQFSRTQPLQSRPVAINELIRKVLLLLEPLVRAKRIDVIANLGPDLPDVDADPVEMEQVILNLMLNARDAMPNGGELTISTGACIRPSDTAIRDDGNQCIAITVSDTGSGIPEGDLDHIFEPFFTTKPNGTGLGLASAYGIVRQHGGDIKVQSAPESGTRFIVYLPPSRSKEQVLHGGPAKAA